MKPLEDVEQAVKNLHRRTTAALDQRILTAAQAALALPRPHSPARGANVWRIIMKSRLTQIAGAAAVLAVAAIVTLVVMNESAAPAYALDQTRAANRGLRYVHIRIDPRAGQLAEAWVQLDENGALLHLRMDFPQTEDGPKVVVWEADKTQVWFKAKRSAVTLYGTEVTGRFPKMLETFDPKLVADALWTSQADGRVKIETQLPSATGEPIRLIATPLSNADQREIYLIDPETKLVDQVEKYKLDQGEYRLLTRWTYLDYNQTPDPQTFVLDLPPGVTLIDETTQLIGLAKGDLTEAEITAQVAREFFEALAAKDYAKAGQLYSGLPADKAEQIFSRLNVVRVVSIGVPQPQPIPGVGGMVVECQVELQRGDQTTLRTFRPAIRPVYSQPQRWTIHGGI